MVSQDSRRAASREKLLSAAAAEFAARGFAGAKVDRIATRARLNKAMIYYHFANKAALYREILAGVFHTIAEAVATDISADTPDGQVRQFVSIIARETTRRPYFASMWLRELADGGTHIDGVILREVRRVLQVLDGIIERGVQAGQFLPVHPLVVQVGIVGPLLMFAASAPARRRLAHDGESLAAPQPEDLVRHIERAAIGALRQPAASVVARGAAAPTTNRRQRL